MGEDSTRVPVGRPSNRRRRVACFDGLRLFARSWRFRPAGTDDLRRATETASDMKLVRFFDGWL
jgi:hypothetical protein